MTDTPEPPSAEDIAQHYTALGHSVDLINAIIAGERQEHTQDETNNRVERNVRHLEIMVAKDFWTNEDMTASNDAITAGKAYIASNS